MEIGDHCHGFHSYDERIFFGLSDMFTDTMKEHVCHITQVKLQQHKAQCSGVFFVHLMSEWHLEVCLNAGSLFDLLVVSTVPWLPHHIRENA